MKKHKTRTKPKYYHASPVRFRFGDLLIGGQGGGSGSEDPRVCLTTSAVPHFTIIHQAYKENWFVYEVEPLGDISAPTSCLEVKTARAQILRRVGTARGLAKKSPKFGSVVHGYRSRVVESYLRHSWRYLK